MDKLRKHLRGLSRPELLNVAENSGLTPLETQLVISRICQQHSRDRSARDTSVSNSCATNHFCNALKKIDSWYKFQA